MGASRARRGSYRNTITWDGPGDHDRTRKSRCCKDCSEENNGKNKRFFYTQVVDGKEGDILKVQKVLLAMYVRFWRG